MSAGPFQHLRKFLKQEDGPTAVEYAVMLALIVVVCVGAIEALGGNASGSFASAASAMIGSATSSDSSDSSSTPSAPTIGSQASTGAAESSGTWVQQDGHGGTWAYNASTGQLTGYYGTSGGGTAIPPSPTYTSSNVGSGKLPDSGGTGVWTLAQ